MIDKREFFGGGGEMGALTRAYDWGSSVLGPPETWSQSLRTALRIVLSTQHPMFIWWGPDLVQFYNDAYRKTLGSERHPSALGQRGAECWKEIWDIIGPQIDLVMRGDGATWHEDQLVPLTRNGQREDVWWTYGFGPIDDPLAPNGIGGVLVVCNDVTERHRSFEALAVSQQRLGLALSAGAIGTWDWHIQTDLVFADERFARACGLGAEESRAGAPISRYLRNVHPEDRERLDSSLKKAIESGDEYAEEYRVERHDGATRWILSRGRCYRDGAGEPVRFSGAAIDITERKEAEQHRMFLVDELRHRGRNMLAMVQAIANQTLTEGSTISDAREKLGSRLAALSRTQDVLTGIGADGVDIGQVIHTAMEPHAGDWGRFALKGPKVDVSPRSAVAFALAFHELATNATKYGALSTSDGRVDVEWTVGAEPDRAFELRWSESGGPPVSPPTRRGFGSRLLERVLSGEFGAVVSSSYPVSGVVWRVVTPLAKIA